MKTLHFTHRGERYKVNEKGFMTHENNDDFSEEWIFLGVTKHHWSNHITVTREQAFVDPSLIVGGLVFDMDHGTKREWGGRYCGRLPRITDAYLTN